MAKARRAGGAVVRASDVTYRGNGTGRALEALVWIGSRRRPFVIQEFRAALDVSLRTAQRHMECLEARGLVERVGWKGPGRRLTWRSRIRIEIEGSA